MSSGSESTPPTRDEVEARLLALVDGTADLDETSNWAGRWVNDEAAVTDMLVLQTLTAIYGVDMPDIPEPGKPPRLIFGSEDYVAWLEDFRAARASETPLRAN